MIAYCRIQNTCRETFGDSAKEYECIRWDIKTEGLEDPKAEIIMIEVLFGMILLYHRERRYTIIERMLPGGGGRNPAFPQKSPKIEKAFESGKTFSVFTLAASQPRADDGIGWIYTRSDNGYPEQ